MAVTKTDQFHVWPYPGQLDDWLADGQGVHTVFARDLVTQLNNIGSYCNPWAQYMQSCMPYTSKNGVTGVTVSADGEYMIFQCPIVVPAGAVRMLWTAGATFVGGTGSIDSAHVYLSTIAYTKTVQGTFFDYTGLRPIRRLLGVVGSGTKPVNIAAAGYKLVTDAQTDGGVVDVPAATTQLDSGTGTTHLSNLVFTLTCSSAAALVMGVADFTCWFLYD